MPLYRRRLPHIYHTDQPVFLTWGLYGSLPAGRAFHGGTLSSGQAFAALDRLLDEARGEPVYLRRPELADMVVEAIYFNGETLGQYALHAFAVMPNHVHLLITPNLPLPRITKSLKGITASRANTMLGFAGKRFWQEESYDHELRSAGGLERIRRYIENNPVRAGLVSDSKDYRWSSAGWGDRGSPADRGSALPAPVRWRWRTRRGWCISLAIGEAG
jgi:putative transposase